MDKRHLKLAALTRWVRAAKDMPAKPIYKPPEKQIGSPFVERMQWGAKGRERWPKLALSQSPRSHYRPMGLHPPGGEVSVALSPPHSPEFGRQGWYDEEREGNAAKSAHSSAQGSPPRGSPSAQGSPSSALVTSHGSIGSSAHGGGSVRLPLVRTLAGAAPAHSDESNSTARARSAKF